MKVLKTITGGRVVQQCLYDNIVIRESDGYIVRKAKNSIRGSYNRWEKNQVRALQALIGANFSECSLFVTLTFSDDRLPTTREQCSRRFGRFIQKLKLTGDVRYIKNIEHSHGEKRWHMHAIMRGPSRDEITKAWSYYGHAEVINIRLRDVFPHKDNRFDQGRGLASYMVKEMREKPGQRLFQPCRGLERPKVYRQLVDDDFQLSVPDQCEFVERTEPVLNIYGSVCRVTYLLPRT